VAGGGGDQAGSAASAATVAAVSPTAAAATAAAGQTLPDGSVEERYQFAYTLLRTGDFEQAESAFKEFLALHSDSSLAGNAQYWLGESYYVRRDYQNAAGAFLTGFQEYPDSRKAPDNLLKLASSLQALGHKEDTCDTLVALGEKFPKASTRIKRTAQSIRRKAGCK
jgi:tol-pal system protein YbgF